VGGGGGGGGVGCGGGGGGGGWQATFLYPPRRKGVYRRIQCYLPRRENLDEGANQTIKRKNVLRQETITYPKGKKPCNTTVQFSYWAGRKKKISSVGKTLGYQRKKGTEVSAGGAEAACEGKGPFPDQSGSGGKASTSDQKKGEVRPSGSVSLEEKEERRGSACLGEGAYGTGRRASGKEFASQRKEALALGRIAGRRNRSNGLRRGEADAWIVRSALAF